MHCVLKHTPDSYIHLQRDDAPRLLAHTAPDGTVSFYKRAGSCRILPNLRYRVWYHRIASAPAAG
jgi:hypothetical protein